MQSYLLVRQKGQATLRNARKCVRMPLPLTIGTSAYADIIVNSHALLPVSYEIQATRGLFSEPVESLRITAVKDGSVVHASELRRFGLDIKGPFPLIPGMTAHPLRRWLVEILVLERQWFMRLPERVRKLLGGGLKQQVRLPIWALVVTSLVALMSVVAAGSKIQEDLSLVPKRLQVGIIDRNTHGASRTRFGYENGVFFHVEGYSAKHKSQLHFDIGGLDEDNEVEVIFNGESVYATKADVSCVESFCSRIITLPPSEEAKIFFRHNGSGTWLIKNILVNDLVMISPSESASVRKWLEAARRAWVDRNVSAENIVLASEQLAKAEDLASTRTGTEQLLIEIQVLRKEVEGSFAEIVNDLTFKVRKDLKLGDNEAAKQSLKLMLRLYPDPADPEHRRLNQLLKETEDM